MTVCRASMGRKENNPEKLEISMKVILRGALRALLGNSCVVSTSRRWGSIYVLCWGVCFGRVRECQDIQSWKARRLIRSYHCCQNLGFLWLPERKYGNRVCTKSKDGFNPQASRGSRLMTQGLCLPSMGNQGYSYSWGSLVVRGWK